ncbi:penicillin-binding protein 1C [Reyranella aquatilis]|uniref:peptidoglycan glycosyltransferase n=1 Tax=Reyranella aquatilis TaxID=2035356 RepID=A0ABS8KQ28_9HYPH|nr:penicillin-binding protein 1C [Reyranella aquatilis]MCC8428186.1 penicillin-binding protein 1C [Reyranella aquatilis]
MKLRILLAGIAVAATTLAAVGLALDRAFPPDLSRYHERSTEVVDANGRLLRAFTTLDGKWRLKTTVDDVDPLYLALLKAYEDRRFDDHWGVDPVAAVRAAWQLAERGRIVSGASTISMQAARLLDPRPRSFTTKAIQSARALQLEWRYSKREVLAVYLTLAPMGGNLEGVRAASLAYFGKEPRQLSAAEAALLVAIPQSPERRRPDRASAPARAARDRVLARGLEHGVIDAPLFEMARSRPAPDRRLALPMQAPHLSAWLAGQSPGAVVPTTLRFELQQSLSQLAHDERRQFADGAEIAMVVLDNRTGGVVAWLGGDNFFGRAGQVDLVRARRSPGSALKPLIYAMAFDDRTLHPETVVEDVPVRFRDWLPRNFDRDHQGAVTVRRALQQSLNVPAVLALEKVGPQRFLSTLRTAGATPGLPPGDTGNSLGIALGSATLSPLEMAGLYAGLANGGSFAPPQVRRDRPRPLPVRLLGPTAAWYVSDVLAEAPLPEGFASLPVALRERRIAFKTGTSAGYRDAWAAGYSTNWTVVVWVGHADGTPRPGQLGRLSALPILFKAFGRLPGEDNRAIRPPVDAIKVSSHRDLPPRMRTLGPHAETSGGPRIAYPPADARIELTEREAIPLNAMGGHGRLRWLVDGRPLDGNQWVPAGAGVARLAVVDEAGRSTSVTVRIVERR